jgi:ubiquinone/menaquinone biosynthesis C-methylase UbiE
MDKAKSNLNSYDNVESLSNFKNDLEIQQYREHKLRETINTVNFLRKIFSHDILEHGIKVLELGSGNSKLLYQLALQKLLNQGYGIEVSKSRFEFAEKWKKDLQINNIKNINADILAIDLEQFTGVDLFICVDNALQFLEPIKKNSVLELFFKISKILHKEGYVVLELWSMHNILKNIYAHNGIYKTWQEFGDFDPFAYMIESIELDDENYVVWNKRFLHRHDLIKSSDMQNILKPYSPKEISRLLVTAGFSDVRIYKNFEFEPHEYNHDEYVVVAKKN